jgi:hypothetical protein
MKASLFFRKQSLVCSFLIITAWLASCSKSGGYGGGGTTPTTYTVSATLNSGSEVPSNATTGSGTLTGTYDASTYIITYKITWTGITGVPTGMHFHGPAIVGQSAGVEVGITGFTSATAGSYSGSATFTPSQGTDLTEGKMYVNIHTAAYPNGEIRGQLSATK